MQNMTAYIIEDEPRAQRILQNLLAAEFPEITVLGFASSVVGAVQWLNAHDGSTPEKTVPDIIFMDVELQDGNSFQIFDKADIKSHVIMTTAYDSYAVKAFEVNSLDYLLKPIEPEDLRRAVSRAKAAQLDAVPPREEPAPDTPVREKYLIRLNDRIVPLKAKEIALFYSEAKNSFVVRTDGTSYVLDESLDTLEQQMDRHRFFRISRSCIIAEDAVDSVTKLVGSRLRVIPKIKFKGNLDLTVSRARVDAFLDWLQQ